MEKIEKILNRAGEEIDSYEFYDFVSRNFNQLKAKLYNVIEASSTDLKQCEAQKGLIKGFCNEHYKNVVDDLENWLRKKGVGFDYELDAGWEAHPAEPLEEVK